MEIGKPRRTVTVEPVEDPVPRELPKELPEKEPEEAPREPEKIPEAAQKVAAHLYAETGAFKETPFEFFLGGKPVQYCFRQAPGGAVGKHLCPDFPRQRRIQQIHRQTQSEMHHAFRPCLSGGRHGARPVETLLTRNQGSHISNPP